MRVRFPHKSPVLWVRKVKGAWEAKRYGTLSSRHRTCLQFYYALLAQWTSAMVYEAKGWEFESLTGYHFYTRVAQLV